MKRTVKERKMLLLADDIISARKFNRICRQTSNFHERVQLDDLEYTPQAENIVTIEQNKFKFQIKRC